MLMPRQEFKKLQRLDPSVRVGSYNEIGDRAEAFKAAMRMHRRRANRKPLSSTYTQFPKGPCSYIVYT